MNRALIAVGLLFFSIRFEYAAQSNAKVTGIVTHPYVGNPVDGAFRSLPLPNGIVRLCSLDRVIQTRTNLDGRFTFFDVPPGQYDLVAGGSGWPPSTDRNIHIGSANVGYLELTLNPVSALVSDCLVIQPTCATTYYSIDYDDPIPQSTSLLIGVVNATRRKHIVGLSKATINLSKAGNNQVLLDSTITDKHGRFRFHLSPGRYELKISRKGFLDVTVKEFLVPLQNPTSVTVFTARLGAISICQ